MPSFPWYAIQVAPRKEQLVASALVSKGYESFLPLYPMQKLWSDRVRITDIPLFSGYVFCRLDVQHRMPVLVTPGVRSIVGTAKIPTPIADGEIEAISCALRNGLLLEPCDQLHHGDRVLVTRGPLAGLEGSFLRHGSRDRLVLSVSLIQRSVAVEIDRLCVEPVTNRRTWAKAVHGEPSGNSSASHSRQMLT